MSQGHKSDGWAGVERTGRGRAKDGPTNEQAGRCSQARPSLTLCVIRPSLRSEPTRPRSEMQKKKKEQVNPRRFLADEMRRSKLTLRLRLQTAAVAGEWQQKKIYVMIARQTVFLRDHPFRVFYQFLYRSSPGH